MTNVTLPQVAVPLADASGRVTKDWYRWAHDLTQRAGGVSGPGTEDLSIAQFDDASIEEIKARLSAVHDELRMLPVADIMASLMQLQDELRSLPIAQEAAEAAAVVAAPGSGLPIDDVLALQALL